MANDKSTLDRVVETYRVVNDMYGSLTALRAAMVAIPVVGGPIDMLLEGGMMGTRLGRLEDLAAQLRARIGGLEKTTAKLHGEEFADLIAMTFRRASETRSRDKRGRFAQIIANQVAEPRAWDEAETAARLLGELEDIHVDVLKVALKRRAPGQPNIGRQTITPSPNYVGGVESAMQPVRLPEVLPAYGELALRLAASDLVARALLHDAGMDMLQMSAMQVLRATALAEWFLSWIEEKGSPASARPT